VRQAWRAAPYRGVARAVEGDPAAAWVVGVAEVRGGKELEAPQHHDGDDGQFLHHGPRPRRRVDVEVDGALSARRLLRPSAPRGGCSRWAALQATTGERLSRGVHDASGGFGSERKRWWKWDEVVAVLVGSQGEGDLKARWGFGLEATWRVDILCSRLPPPPRGLSPLRARAQQQRQKAVDCGADSRRGSPDGSVAFFFLLGILWGSVRGPTCIENNGWCGQRQQRAELWTWVLWLCAWIYALRFKQD
jgi:hypothetical protein